jgi:cell fate regulator YaaT (PSP1 superfamily)
MTGGCNRLNTYDWLSSVPIPEDQKFTIVEVSFKHGSRKDFYRNSSRLDVMTGDLVVVESEGGYDVGRISLSGELVKLQLAKRRSERRRRDLPRILRKARDKDLESLTEARAREGAVMIRARQIAKEAGVNMKIADVEFQGDLRKATFYYTSDDRVDFRDLIRQFATEFRVKVDMRQIGARQEAGKIGGIGACGRELCCSTWLTEFQSVSTSAARYQNLAINQSKLSGQCGRLKCCLNYELETYVQGMKAFPKGAKRLKTADGEAVLQKTDLFRVLMYYSIPQSENPELFALTPDDVRAMLALNEKGEVAPSLSGIAVVEAPTGPVEVEFVESAQVSLRTLERSARKRKGGKKGDGRGEGRTAQSEVGGRAERMDRGQRNERDDRGDRPDRGSRPDRGDRPDRGSRPDRSDRPDRGSRGDKPPRGERPERKRPDALEAQERKDFLPGGPEQDSNRDPDRDAKRKKKKKKKGPRPDGQAAGGDNTQAQQRPDRPDRADRADRADRPDRGERPDRPDRADRPDRGGRQDRPDRGERPPGAERVDGEGSAEGASRNRSRNRGRSRGRGGKNRGSGEGGDRPQGGDRSGPAPGSSGPSAG